MSGTYESTNTIPGALRRTWRYAGTPSDGTSGTYAGVAEKGDLLIDTTNAKLYQNTNTKASPTWTEKAASGAALATDVADMASSGTSTANALGSASTAAPIDHVHALGAHDHSGATKGGSLGTGVVATAMLADDCLSADATGRAKIADDFFDSSTVDSKFEDSSIAIAKVNFSTATPGNITPDASAAEGSASSLARSDHVHGITCAAPSGGIGAADAEGSASTFARSDHVHKATIANDTFFVGRNAAGNGDINVWKVNSSDLIEFGANLAALTMGGTLTMADKQISFSTGNITFSGAGYISIGATPASAGSIRLPNNTFGLTARNAADGDDVNIVKVNASDLIEFGTSLAAATLGGTLSAADQAIDFTSGHIEFGTTPADAGSIRQENNAAVWTARNAGDDGNVSGWKVNAADDYEAAADVNLAGNTLYGDTAANGDLILSATTNGTVTTSYIIASNMFDATADGLATAVVAGAVGDGSFTATPINGCIAIDSSNGRLYFKYGDAWHYCSQDA